MFFSSEYGKMERMRIRNNFFILSKDVAIHPFNSSVSAINIIETITFNKKIKNEDRLVSLFILAKNFIEFDNDNDNDNDNDIIEKALSIDIKHIPTGNIDKIYGKNGDEEKIVIKAKKSEKVEHIGSMIGAKITFPKNGEYQISLKDENNKLATYSVFVDESE